MKTLVINCGSSSLKYELFDMQSRTSLASGVAERIGEEESQLVHQSTFGNGRAERGVSQIRIDDHAQAIILASEQLSADGHLRCAEDLFGVGHRVVHGGEKFRRPILIDDQVIQEIRHQIPLAPIHNPANLAGIESVRKNFPTTPQAAVFDTAFHQTMPPEAYRYALPEEIYENHRVRRYGFHGTSHQYVVRAAAELMGRSASDVNLIVLHLGNGASAAAVQGGRCMDTSMGLTPLEGLMMGTRCGDVDPGALLHIMRELGMSLDELDETLNKRSGLIGICGDNDMREVLARASRGDARAKLAADMYVYRIQKYIGAYSAVLPTVDAIVFTAGIGENSSEIRLRVCQRLENLGVRLCAERNAADSSSPREIQADGSEVRVLVVPTNEELEIAEQTIHCIRAANAAR